MLIFTKEQVVKHCTENDRWIIFNGYVYDISNFIRLHPWGLKLLNYLGKYIKDVLLDKGYLWHLQNNNVF